MYYIIYKDNVFRATSFLSYKNILLSYIYGLPAQIQHVAWQSSLINPGVDAHSGLSDHFLSQNSAKSEHFVAGTKQVDGM